jgi:hypothetical protein
MHNASDNRFSESSNVWRSPSALDGKLGSLRWGGWLLPLLVACGAILAIASAMHREPARSDWETALADMPLRDDAFIAGHVENFPVVGIEGMPMRMFGIERRDSTETDWLMISLPYSETSDDHLRLIPQQTRVRSLVLDGTRITDAGLHHLRGMADLETLSLGGTNVTDAGAQTLGDLRSLQSLDLRRTKITNSAMAPLGRLRRLGQLNLSGTQVDGAGLAQLQGLDRLETILLNDTPLDDGDMAALCRLTSLRQISLHGTSISKAGIAELARLPRFVSCELDGGTYYRSNLDAPRRRLEIEK